jgi:anthranilate synthase component 2
MKLLIVDNFDSFTFNIVELIKRIGMVRFDIIKSNHVIINDVKYYDKIIFSPGPGLPKEFPIMFDILKSYLATKSFLGVCLGHQAIAEFFGAQLENLDSVVHGIKKTIAVTDTNEVLFNRLPKKIDVGLYHSWIVSKKKLPECLKITAESEDGQIMALAHKHYNIRGVQFHPESIMTDAGKTIIHNWLNQL